MIFLKPYFSARYLMKRPLNWGLLIFLSISLQSFASDIEKPIILGKSTDSSDTEEMLYLDPGLIDVTIEGKKREELLQEIPDVYEIYIQDLSTKNLERFLQIKNNFMSKFESFLKRASAPPEKIRLFLDNIESQMYQSAKLICEYNTVGVPHQFVIRTGFAFNTEILARFVARFPWFAKYIPEKGGYFFLVGAGSGLYRVTDPKTGKKHVILDLLFDFQHLKRVTSMIVELVNIDAAIFGIRLEKRKNFDRLVTKSTLTQDFQYMGPGGRIARGPDFFAWDFAVSIPLVTTIGFPPMTSALAFFESESTVRKISINLSSLKPKEIVSSLKRNFRKVKTCEGVFSN